MAARSDVVVTTVIAAAAGRADAASPIAASAAAITARVNRLLMSTSSERVRAVRADREQELEQDLVGVDALGVGRAAELAADLAELARPVGQERRSALVALRGI